MAGDNMPKTLVHEEQPTHGKTMNLSFVETGCFLGSARIPEMAPLDDDVFLTLLMLCILAVVMWTDRKRAAGKNGGQRVSLRSGLNKY